MSQLRKNYPIIVAPMDIKTLQYNTKQTLIEWLFFSRKAHKTAKKICKVTFN